MNETAKVRTHVVIFINDTRYEAPKPSMTGAEIKALGGIPAENRLFEEVPGPRDDIPIADSDVVELKNGTRFYDLPRGVHGAPTLEQVLEPEFDKLRGEFENVDVRPQPDGSIHVVVSPVPLPGGWSMSATRILVLIPPGYPDQRPSGFFAEHGLTLSQGTQPKGSGVNQVAGEPWMYFCWHPATWNPTADTLWKYVKLMTERFREVA